MTTAGRVPVVCAIITSGETVLAARRPEGKTNGGLWEFPGGKVHAGETLEAALHREIREELGITIMLYESKPAVLWKYPWITIELFPFICSMTEGEVPRTLDHSALRFVSREDAMKLPWAPADRKIVDGYFGI